MIDGTVPCSSLLYYISTLKLLARINQNKSGIKKINLVPIITVFIQENVIYWVYLQPMYYSRDNAKTLNIFMKKDVTKIQELFINNTKVASDYWLVQMENNDYSRIQQLFSALPLKYTSLVFPFYYSSELTFNNMKN